MNGDIKKKSVAKRVIGFLGVLLSVGVIIDVVKKRRKEKL